MYNLTIFLLFLFVVGGFCQASVFETTALSDTASVVSKSPFTTASNTQIDTLRCSASFNESQCVSIKSCGWCREISLCLSGGKDGPEYATCPARMWIWKHEVRRHTHTHTHAH